MAEVISDTGPLVALAKVDLLSVLRTLFGRVQIPEAVWSECHGRHGPDTMRIDQAVEAGWLHVTTPSTERRPHVPPRWSRNLGRGEVAALETALASDRALLIVDDRLARRAAMQLDVNYLGTVRTLWLAERRKVIDSAAVVIERMAAYGYRVSPKILHALQTEPSAR